MKISSPKKKKVVENLDPDTGEAIEVKKVAPPLGPPRNELERKQRILRAMVTYFYAIQQERIAAGLRASRLIVALHKDDQKILADVSDSFEEIEKQLMKKITAMLKGFNVYNRFLKEVHGVGPTIAAVLISEFDIHDRPAPEGYSHAHTGSYTEGGILYRSRTISQWWKYAGLAPIEITSKEGEKKMIGARKVAGQKISYNPFLKTKLLGVLASCFIKSKSPYKVFYDEHKKMREAQNWGANPANRHRDAIRHMIKCFLMDFFYAWREIEGMPARPPYGIEKLGKSWSQIWHVKEHPCIKKEETPNDSELPNAAT